MISPETLAMWKESYGKPWEDWSGLNFNAVKYISDSGFTVLQLIAEIERLQKENEKLKEALDAKG